MDTLFKIADASAHGILYLMGALSVVSVAIMLERFLFLRQIGSSSSGMATEFRKVIEGQDIGKIESLSKSSASLEGRALGYGLTFVKEHGENGLDELFNSFKLIERPSLEKNLNFLGTIASNAPYIGLLGTVMGIMKAFNDLAVAPGQGNEVVMAGIGHALVSTAIGLVVAIPAVVAFNLFQKRVGLVLNNIDAARDLCLAYTKSRKA
ncbi:MAG: MotA/TolQ/ExbB proton channel family protein [Cryobacterium sp.]|nr:MotA/TolQ/ExbB proton channel family protein [Oligoflexia bacterium]